MRRCWRTQHWPFYVRLLSIWKKLVRWKSSGSGCLMSWPQIKKNRFEVLSSLILHNGEPFLKWIVTCNEKWILYDTQERPAQWLDWEKHFPKQTHTWKKVMVTVQWSAACPIHYSFLNPSKPVTSEKHAQQIDEMHAVGLVNRKGPFFPPWPCPTTRGTTNASKVERVGLWSSAMFTWSLANSLPSSILTAFCRENAATTSRRQKLLSKSSSNAEAQIFNAKRINKFISHWKNCVDCNSSSFD